MVGWGLTQISLTEGEHELLRNRILQTIPGQNLDEEEPPDSMPTLGFLLMTSRHPYYPLDLRPSHQEKPFTAVTCRCQEEFVSGPRSGASFISEGNLLLTQREVVG